MRALVITVIICAWVGDAALCQQLHSWSSIQQLRHHVNPGFVNLYDLYTDGNPLEIDLVFQQQWSGYEGAPQTVMAGVRYSDIGSHMTFGGFVANDMFGPTDYTEVQLQYAYQLHFERGESHFLSGGLAVSAMQVRVQESAFITETSGDPLLGAEDQSRIVPNVSLGLYYQKNLARGSSGGTNVFGGLSARQLIPSRVTFDGIAGNAGSLDREIHMYAFAGLRQYYDRQSYDYVEPYASVQFVSGAPIHYDLGFRLSAARQRFFAGAGLSTTFQLHVQVGFGVTDAFKLLYTNNSYLGKTYAGAVGSSHEVGLSFRNLLGW
jgi:type IX secretion system PorP/SprF family membrane protein